LFLWWWGANTGPHTASIAMTAATRIAQGERNSRAS
jgi:hypothetical protein